MRKLFASRQEFFGLCIALTYFALVYMRVSGHDFGVAINTLLGGY